MNETNALPQLLAAARKAAGLTRTQLNSLLGTSYDLSSKLETPREKGGVLLTRPRWQQLEEALGHHLTDLLNTPELRALVDALPAAAPDERTITRPDQREPALGLRLRELRKSRDLTQEQVSTATGIQEVQVSRIERAKVTPTTPDLRAFAKFYGVSYAFLLDGEEQQTSREQKLNEQVVALQRRNEYLRGFIKSMTGVDPDQLAEALKAG